MNIFLIHQNFPGQFSHLAMHLAKIKGISVFGIGEKENINDRGRLPGITTIAYDKPKNYGEYTHHYLQTTEAAIRRGQALVRTLLMLSQQGINPDLIYVHPGWGEGMFLKDIYPNVPIAMFCEFFFQAREADLGFDPEFKYSDDFFLSVRIRNVPQLVSLEQADLCICPTQWQASRYPSWIQEKIQVVHEGINVDVLRPAVATVYLHETKIPGDSIATLSTALPRGAKEGGQPIVLTKEQKILLYVARNLEPYRGFHTFMRYLPHLQRLYPDLITVIVGKDGVSYSFEPKGGGTYKQQLLKEVNEQLDLSRVHFLGRVPRDVINALYRVATVHVYLTYPFVLSWSVMESMACGGLLVASRTEPVQEVIKDGENGLLFDFFDQEEFLRVVGGVFANPEHYKKLRENARETIVTNYNLDTCLRRQCDLLEALVHRKGK